MKLRMRMMFRPVLTMVSTVMFLAALPSQAKDAVGTDSVPVRMTITANVENGKRMPEIQKEDIVIKKGNERLPVVDFVAAQEEHAGLELFILLDDASGASLGAKLDELRTFVKAQPATTSVGIGYMKNASVEIVQNFTADHAQAAKVLRLPVGSVGAYGSPYLSVVDLMKRWPESANRREVVMVTDGIDRAKRERNALLNPDVNSAIEVAQRTGTIIHTIYSPGAGHARRNFWRATNGENAMAKLSDATGGESYFLGLQSPVSFAPYLDQLQKILDNQYLLTFSAKPDKKAGLQYITVSTELAGVDFGAADAVKVPAAK